VRAVCVLLMVYFLYVKKSVSANMNTCENVYIIVIDKASINHDSSSD
jgi:hypothetical protein